ncbi:MAG: radical SAM protein [Acidimicrobiales bacterium]
MHECRHDWTIDEVLAVIERPFHELLAEAHACHVERFSAHEIEAAKLLSIKTGGCPEDCAYCPQSAHHDTGLKAEPLMATDEIVAAAREAKAEGATRFCMGAAWRSPSDKQVTQVAAAVEAVGALGMETCVTLGMLTPDQAARLGEAGLDYYNHNLDTSPDFYGEIITTRTYEDRLDTLAACRDASASACAPGASSAWVTGAAGEPARPARPARPPSGERADQPADPGRGNPLDGLPEFPPLELVRTIAAARLVMPRRSYGCRPGGRRCRGAPRCACTRGRAASSSASGCSPRRTTVTTAIVSCSPSSTRP